MAAGLALLIPLLAQAQVPNPVPEPPRPQRQAEPAPAELPQFRPQDARFKPRMVVDMNQAMPAARQRRERFEAQAFSAMAGLRLDSVRVSDRVRQLVAGLDDPSFEVRERSSRELLDASIDDHEIWAMLDRAELGEEAHERLLRVAVKRALEKPRGAIGVRMANAPPERPGVLVQATIPGLPADRVLLPGDVIERIDDAPITTTDDLADLLQGQAPGAEVRVVVVRSERDAQGRPVLGPDGKPVERRREFRMALGNAVELERADAAMPGLPPGLRGQNLSLDRRMTQARAIEARFTRPLPPAVAVPAPAGERMVQPSKPVEPSAD